MGGLREVAKMLKAAGCRSLYVDGSFASDKEMPNDFDACWSIDGVDENLVDPVLFDFANVRFNQKARYGGELFPAELKEGSTGLVWLDFFQQNLTTGDPKGILLIDLTKDIP